MTITTSKTTGAIDLDEVVSTVAPVIHAHAQWQEQNGRLHQEVLAALEETNVLQMRIPRCFGGLDSSARDMVQVATELGRVDGSTAWAASVWWIPAWMVAFFTPEAQQEVFATPNVRVCGTLTPGGTGHRVDGGDYEISGQWRFISGALHSQWQEVIFMAPTTDGKGQEPISALVPMADLTIIDDWDVSGMRASGSVSTVADRVRVPPHRCVPLANVMGPSPAQGEAASSSIYGAPFGAYAAAAAVGAFSGLASGAVDAFERRIASGSGITYSGYSSQAEAPVTHLQLARATMGRDEAIHHAHDIARLVDEKAEAGAPWSVEERALVRAHQAAAAERASETAMALDAASGGSSVRMEARSQRIVRDVHAMSKHGLIYPATAYELYGRVRCGLEPDTHYI